MEPVFSGLRKISKQKVIKEIEKHSLKSPKSLGKSPMHEMFRRVYNVFAKLFKMPRWMSNLTKLLMSLGIPEDEALEMEIELSR